MNFLQFAADYEERFNHLSIAHIIFPPKSSPDAFPCHTRCKPVARNQRQSIEHGGQFSFDRLTSDLQTLIGTRPRFPTHNIRIWPRCFVFSLTVSPFLIFFDRCVKNRYQVSLFAFSKRLFATQKTWKYCN